MMSVYDREYIEEGALCFGEALDYVAGSCGMDIEAFMDIFIISGYADRFEKGDPSVVPGLSGTELVCRALKKSGLDLRFPDAVAEFSDGSLEYWTGYFMIYLMWYNKMTFRNVMEDISRESLLECIPKLLSAAETERERLLKELAQGKKHPVRLQELRKECGYSQRELAEKSGVNLRTLQQYEVRSKDINKAAASTLLSLSSVLGCKITDLMEN